MSPKTLMSGSAIVFAGLGGSILFYPQEIVALAGMASAAELPVQLLAAGFLALASLNWMGREAVYGGIYGRPIVVANFGFGIVMGGTLVSAAWDERLGSWAWALAAMLMLHALGFWWVMRVFPSREGSSDGTRRPGSS